MVRYCSVPQCATYCTEAGVSFHYYPEDAVARKKWLTRLGKDKEPSQYAMVCSKHFSKDAFVALKRNGEVYKRRKLKINAEPTLNLPQRGFDRSKLRRKAPFLRARVLNQLTRLVDSVSSSAEYATLAASILGSMPSMPKDCIVAMSADAAFNQSVSCSQKTQATVTTRAIGTQCALTFLVSASSQTEEQFSGDGAHIAVAARPETCSCRPRFGNTGRVSTESKNIQFRRELHSCLSCEQHNETTHVKGCVTGARCSCTICKKAFRKNCSLYRHMREHTSKTLHVCSTCNKSFTLRSTLVRHESVHSGERPHTCGICHKSFTQKRYLVAHERRHSGKRPFVCSTCLKSFATRHNLVAHEMLHSGESPYVCSICKKGFVKKGNLVVHERVHSGERPYACSFCPNTFRQRASLDRHETMHCGKRPYQCSICHKCFTTTRHLVTHEGLHSSEGPHQCTICHKSFTKNWQLVKHARCHSSKKPYVCCVCQKGFTIRSHLVAHERLHSGDCTLHV